MRSRGARWNHHRHVLREELPPDVVDLEKPPTFVNTAILGIPPGILSEHMSKCHVQAASILRGPTPQSLRTSRGDEKLAASVQHFARVGHIHADALERKDAQQRPRRSLVRLVEKHMPVRLRVLFVSAVELQSLLEKLEALLGSAVIPR
eukprot:scaffold214_cov249-Pinguiococcus_pyrenoidosus.AAC.24